MGLYLSIAEGDDADSLRTIVGTSDEVLIQGVLRLLEQRLGFRRADIRPLSPRRSPRPAVKRLPPEPSPEGG